MKGSGIARTPLVPPVLIQCCAVVHHSRPLFLEHSQQGSITCSITRALTLPRQIANALPPCAACAHVGLAVKGSGAVNARHPCNACQKSFCQAGCHLVGDHRATAGSGEWGCMCIRTGRQRWRGRQRRRCAALCWVSTPIPVAPIRLGEQNLPPRESALSNPQSAGRETGGRRSQPGGVP